MNSQPLITVITLSYNSEYLFEAIQSVLEQDYSKIEYILVDDGSKEFNKKAVEEYIFEHKGNNIKTYKVIVNEVNLGTVKASNIAITNSSGEYLFNLSGDDVFASMDVLSKWVIDFQNNNYEISTAYRQIYSEDLKKSYDIFPEQSKVNLIISKDNQAIFKELTKANFIFGACTAKSRECINKFGLYDEQYQLIEDYSKILYEIRSGVKLGFFDYLAVKYRVGGVSSPTKFNQKYDDDSRLIVKNEILPYVTDKTKYLRNYEKWKKIHLKEKKFLFENYSCGGNHKKLLVLYLRHPIRGYRVLLGKIKKRIRKK